jgi:hypothetical protein
MHQTDTQSGCVKRPDNSYQGALTYFLSSLPVQAYPLRFRLLISAISVLSKGRAVMVDYNKVCQLIGGERKIRDLGFMSYQQLVETACAEGHTNHGNFNAWRWVRLCKPLVSVPRGFRMIHPTQMPRTEANLHFLLSVNHELTPNGFVASREL